MKDLAQDTVYVHPATRICNASGSEFPLTYERVVLSVNTSSSMPRSPTCYTDESAFPFTTNSNVISEIDYPLFYIKIHAFTLNYQILRSVTAASTGNVSLRVSICEYSGIPGYTKEQSFATYDRYSAITPTTYTMNCEEGVIQPMVSIFRKDVVTDTSSGKLASIIRFSPYLCGYYNNSSSTSIVTITGNIIFDLYYCPYF